MTDRSTDVFWEDSFARDDSTALGNDWSGEGDIQILDEVARQSSGSIAEGKLTVAATTAASGLNSDYFIVTKVSCADDTSARTGRILLRFSDSDTDGYMVGLKWEVNVLTLEIVKTVADTSTVLTSEVVTTDANTVSDTFDDILQLLGAAIYDTVDGVVIQAFFNDEQRPMLEWTDREHPNYKQSGNIGFEFGDNDASVAGHVYLHSFRVVALVDEQESNEVVPRRYTAGFLRDRMRERATRDSRSSLDGSAFLEFVNEANQELHSELVNPPWLNETYRFKMSNGDVSYELPPNTITIDEIVYDVDNQNPLQIIDEQQWRRLGFTDTTGQPDLFYLTGYGRGGGPVIKPYPRPTEDSTFEVVLKKAPNILIDDNDVPELPDHFCAALIEGALCIYSLRNTDRTLLFAAERRWNDWKRRIKRSIAKSTTLREHGRVVHSFRQRGGTRTAIQNARYGIRR